MVFRTPTPRRPTPRRRVERPEAIGGYSDGGLRIVAARDQLGAHLCRPGVASLIAAATAWSGLAADFAAAATGHRSVIEALTSGPWLGPASAQVVSAVSPFITWLSNSAEQAGQTASQASAAASAYEAAFAARCPPPVIAANRALVQALTATNIFGQNSGAIAQLEAQYAEFWAQDSGAMYTYAGSAAAATQLSPLAAPAEVADPLRSGRSGSSRPSRRRVQRFRPNSTAVGSQMVPASQRRDEDVVVAPQWPRPGDRRVDRGQHPV